MMPLMSSFHGNATFGATSPASRGYQSANSPGPNGHDIYSEHGYVQASSPQPIQVTINRVRTHFYTFYHFWMVPRLSIDRGLIKSSLIRQFWLVFSIFNMCALMLVNFKYIWSIWKSQNQSKVSPDRWIWTEHDPSSNVVPYWQSNIMQKIILGYTVPNFPKNE